MNEYSLAKVQLNNTSYASRVFHAKRWLNLNNHKKRKELKRFVFNSFASVGITALLPLKSILPNEYSVLFMSFYISKLRHFGHFTQKQKITPIFNYHAKNTPKIPGCNQIDIVPLHQNSKLKNNGTDRIKDIKQGTERNGNV